MRQYGVTWAIGRVRGRHGPARAQWCVIVSPPAAAAAGPRLQAGLKGSRDAFRVGLCEVRPLAGEQIVDGAAPQPQPALEVSRAQTHAGIQGGVRTEGPAAVGARAEQDRLPERGDLRDVGLDVELGDVDEDPPDDGIGQRSLVERSDQPLAVAALLDVAAVCMPMPKDTNGLSAGPLR